MRLGTPNWFVIERCICKPVPQDFENFVSARSWHWKTKIMLQRLVPIMVDHFLFHSVHFGLPAHAWAPLNNEEIRAYRRYYWGVACYNAKVVVNVGNVWCPNHFIPIQKMHLHICAYTSNQGLPKKYIGSECYRHLTRNQGIGHSHTVPKCRRAYERLTTACITTLLKRLQTSHLPPWTVECHEQHRSSWNYLRNHTMTQFAVWQAFLLWWEAHSSLKLACNLLLVVHRTALLLEQKRQSAIPSA